MKINVAFSNHLVLHVRAALYLSLLIALANIRKPFHRNIMTILEMLKEQRRRNEDRREFSCSYLQCDVRGRKMMGKIPNSFSNQPDSY